MVEKINTLCDKIYEDIQNLRVPTDARRRFDYLIIVSVQISSIPLNLFS